MWQQALWVALGGALGSVGRFLIGHYAKQWWPGLFPWGTLIANVLGALLIGLFLGLFTRGQLNDTGRLLLMTGFCGGFTTFSTFAQENLALLRDGQYGMAALYLGMSLLAGIGAVAFGMAVSRA